MGKILRNENENLTEITLKEFQESGLLWFINRILHMFGIAFVLVREENGDYTRLFVARTCYRGFMPDVEDEGFKQVTAYLKDNIEELEKETEG